MVRRVCKESVADQMRIKCGSNADHLRIIADHLRIIADHLRIIADHLRIIADQ